MANKVKNDESAVVSEGQVYKERDSDLEVIPFFVDLAASSVQFAPVGRSAEDRASIDDFNKRFELVGKSRLAQVKEEK